MDRIKLETKHVSIEFPGVKALDDINFEVTTGEIRAVVGANGAGKSTLMKVLAGANSTYTGDVLLNGKKVEVRTPVDAKKLGIQIVYQEVDMALYPTLSVAENIVQNDMVMGKSGYIVNWKKAYKQGREALDRLHIGRDQVDEHELVQNLSLAQKQMVLIAKAIRSECNFLILDEPTAPLSNTETEELFRIVKHLHETENIAILFISHRLNEILEVCENYTVMRNGKMIDTTPVTGETTTKEIVEKMLGRKFEENFPKEACQIGEEDFFCHVTHKTWDAILHDIRKAHENDMESAPAITPADELIREVQKAMQSPGDRVQQFTEIFCKAFQLKYKRLSQEERSLLKKLFKKSPLIKQSGMNFRRRPWK